MAVRSEGHPQEIAARACARWKSPGMQYVAVTTGGSRIEAVSGIADAAEERPILPDTVFLSCSCTKVLTAILALQLVDEGLLELDRPLGAFIADTPYPPAITLRQLLNHTSGIPNPAPLTWVRLAPAPTSFDEGEVLHRIVSKHARLASQPGYRYRYSNLGYWVVGRILEAVTGSSFAALVASRVRDRLNIESHSLSCDPPPAVRAARGHFPRWSIPTFVAGALTPRWIWEKSAAEWRRCAHLTMYGPAYGGVFATASAYAAVLNDLLSERPVLVSGAARASLLQQQSSADGVMLKATLGFRIGSHRGQLYFAKPGGGPGFSGNLRIYPEAGVATVHLRNSFAFDERTIEAISDQLDAEMLASL